MAAKVSGRCCVSENTYVIAPKSGGGEKFYLLSLHQDGKTFGLRVVDGKIIGEGELSPEDAAKVFFDRFIQMVGAEFIKESIVRV